MIGCLLSIEAIKVLRLSHQSEAVQLTGSMQPLLGRQIYYDARMSSFHEFKLPRRSDKCNICGSAPTITSLQDSKLWLEESLRSSSQRPKLMDAKYEVTAIQYNEFLSRNTPHILLDVRSAVQYSIVNLKARCDEHSGRCLSIPWKEISNKSKINTVQSLLQSVLDDIKSDDCVDIFVLCRRGNDSISVTNFLISEWCEPTSAGGCDGLTMWGRVVRIRNIRGGLLEWSKSVDTNFPMY
jgi:adenylyltransferase/sulfurtransferase